MIISQAKVINTSVSWIFLTLQQTFISHSIIVFHGSIGVKYKQSNVFSLVFEIAKTKKVIYDVMKHMNMNVKQLEIEKHCKKVHQQITKQNLEYLKLES
jgi:hypothetical protein